MLSALTDSPLASAPACQAPERFLPRKSSSEELRIPIY